MCCTVSIHLSFGFVEHKWSKKMQSTLILLLLPSTSFFSTLHSDLDYTEASTLKMVVTDNKSDLSFKSDCTRVTIKTQITSLTRSICG